MDDTEQAYRLTFKDGTSIIAGARHLWDCEYIYGKRKAVEWTTEEIFTRTRDYRERFKDRPSAQRDSMIRIPVCKPLQTEEADLPLDPYTYGYWLGNGCANEPWITVRPAKNAKPPVCKKRSASGWLSSRQHHISFFVQNPKTVLE